MQRALSRVTMGMATLLLVACAVPGVKWVNPRDSNDDGAVAKRVCDVELGLGVQGTRTGPGDPGTSKSVEYAIRALSYQEDLKRCMAGKGYEAVVTQ